MNYPPPPPLQHPPQQSQPPSSYGPPMGPPPQYNSQRPAPPTASGAGLALQHPSQVESVPHYGGWAGQASPRSQNYYTIDRPTPTPTSASSSAVRTGASLSRKKSSSRISPGQMPRPDKPQTDLIYHTRSGTGRRNPPVVNSLYVAVDTGNANPRFLRSSMVAPPATPELLRGTGLPLALHVTPFAALAPGEDPVPEVDYGQSPPRCKRCSGYVSPFVTWLDNGHRWQCALCQTANATPDWYVSALDGSGQRLDRLQRPELTRGTVDFALPPSLFAEAPKENVVAFAVDVSYDAVQSGFALASLRAVHAVLRSLHQDYERRVARVREAFYQRRKQPTAADEAELAQALRGVEDWQVGVLTFHSQLQFYDVRLPPDGDGGGVALDAVRVLVGDADEPFCPLPPPRWLHRFSRPDGAARLFALLERLPSLLNALSLSTGGLPPRDPQRRFAAPTAAVVAVEEALRAQGGRLYVFATHHSTVGAGAAGKATREALGPGAHGSADELLLYSCPGAPCAFLDRVVSAGSGSAGSGSAGGGGGGLLGSVLSLAGGVNNAGNGVDRKVAAVATGGGRALPTVSSTASLAALAASPSSASAGGGGGGGGGAREKLREARVAELQTAAAWHWRLAEACAAAALSVSTFVGVGDLYDEAAAPRLFDTTQAADLALRTGGKVFVARGSMRAEDHVAWMENQLAHELLRGGAGYAGRDVTAKLRASRHVALEQFYGGGAFDALDEEWRLPAADAATSATFALALTGALRDEERVYLQFAAMYTTPARQRRIRVHNVALHASEKATTVYRNCDIEAIVGALARVAAHRALEQPLGAEPGGPRSFLTAALVDVLVKYRQLCSSASPKGQLVLPESLKVLPMLVLGLLKHPAFVENVAAGPAAPARLLSHASERACELRRLFAQPLRELVNSAHPRVYNLFALLDADRAATATGDGDGDEDDDAAVGSEDDVDGLDDDDAELSPERQEDRSHWTLARSASFPQEAGALAASQSSTRLDMLAVATGVPAAQPPLLPPPPPPLSTPPAPLPVVTGPPLYSFPTSYPPPPSTLPPPAAPPTAPLYAPPSLPPPQPSLSPAASLASLSPPPLSLAGYAMASAVASDYSAAPAAALSASGQLRLSVPPKTRRQRPFRPLRLLRRQGGVHTARRLKLLALQTLQGSSAEFESDQIYVVDDRSLLWLYVGRAVSQELLEELFVLPAQAPFERPAEVGVRTTTALGRRMRLFLDLLVADAPQKPELRVVWADLGAQNRLLHKFSTRLLEDAAGGALSYTDFLCSVHSKIQARL